MVHVRLKPVFQIPLRVSPVPLCGSSFSVPYMVTKSTIVLCLSNTYANSPVTIFDFVSSVHLFNIIITYFLVIIDYF